MASLSNALQSAVGSIPECIAAGYVDIDSGMLLGVESVDSHPTDVIELLAAATADLFQGTNVRLIETIFKNSRGLSDDGRHYFQEMVINSDNLLHLFMRGANQGQIACFVCRRSANLGLALARARGALPAVEAAI